MKKNLPQTLNPLTYIKTKLKDLPMECYISKAERDSGFIAVLVVRGMPSGKFCVASYLLDVFCMGVKSTTYLFAISQEELQKFASKIGDTLGGLKITSNENAHNHIFGALDYAEDLGIKPDKDWAITSYFLSPDYITDDIDNIEFGKDGKPFYVAGPHDNAKFIINTIRRKVGDGNFHYIIPIDMDM